MDATSFILALALGGGGSAGMEAVVAWNGQSTPDVTKIPAGVTVTYSGTTYTGTLAASSSTAQKLYFVYNTSGTSPNVYNEYITIGSSTYSWEMIGTTQLDLTEYLKYTAQTLTDAQKAQARTNIGACNYIAVTEAPTTLAEGTIAIVYSE